MRAAIVACLCVTGLGSAGCSEPAGVMMNEIEAPGVLQVVDYRGTVLLAADSSVDWSMPIGSGVLAPPRVMVAPDTVQVGHPFTVIVTTIGLNGCWAPGGLWARAVEGGFDFRPTDVHSGYEFCTEMALYLKRAVSVSFDAPGEYTLRVKGRRLHYGNTAWEEPVTAQRRIVAQ